jgi:CheY-like chemotaxis protein
VRAATQHLAIIRRSGQGLLSLINDILDLSKIEAGKMAPQPEPCDLSDLLTGVIGIMQVPAGQRDVGLSLEYAGQVPKTIRTDPLRLRQAMVNLVANAVKFTERGQVRVVASLLSDWRGSPAVRLDVIDTGIGISPGQLAGLFRPFVQADASTSRKYGGTGLGLAITQGIAKLLGGELSARSAQGKGSTFCLTIPTGPLEGVAMLDRPCVPADQAAGPPPAPGPGAKPLAGTRVLLAEDSRDNVLLIQTVLRKAGATVDTADNGLAALRKARTAGADAFDVILMDMQMPEMDGYEATSALRSAGYARPILALTAHSMSSDRDKCLAAGCNDYLTKPIDRQALIEAVARWAGRLEPARA